MQILDTHCHWDFIPTPEIRQQVAQSLHDQGIRLIAQTVRPLEYQSLRREMLSQSFDQSPLLSLGFHPWYIKGPDQVAEELPAFDAGVTSTPLIGEIGLDYSPGLLKQVPADLQIEVLTRLLKSVADQASADKPYILSIHTVRSASQVLDIWQDLDLVEANMVPILHRFNGTSDELTRHLRLGGYVSVHPQMFQSKKGRAYLKQVPMDRLLLETDLPSDSKTQAGEYFVELISQSLKSTLEALIQLKGPSVVEHIMINQTQLYGDLISQSRAV